MGVRQPDPGWFDAIARFLGPAYLRNAFTKGTEQEIEFLVDALELGTGMRVLDAGCGPGRHALALARRGFTVVGVDHSTEFIALANAAAVEEGLPAHFVVGDVRALPMRAAFDALVCLCQGGFGLLGGRHDTDAFGEMVSRIRPGGGVALSAFSAAFAVRHLEEGDAYDVATGVFHELAMVRDDTGAEASYDLWTTCFTARELQLLAVGSDVAVEAIAGVAPGRFELATPRLDHPELLLLGRRGNPGFRTARGAQ